MVIMKQIHLSNTIWTSETAQIKDQNLKRVTNKSYTLVIMTEQNLHIFGRSVRELCEQKASIF